MARHRRSASSSRSTCGGRPADPGHRRPPAGRWPPGHRRDRWRCSALTGVMIALAAPRGRRRRAGPSGRGAFGVGRAIVPPNPTGFRRPHTITALAPTDRRRPDLADLVVIGASVGAFVTLLLLGRGLTFFADEWAVMAERSISLDSFLRPFNEHWLGIMTVVYRLMLGVFGLSSYMPYLALLAALHLVVVWEVYVLARRATNAMARRAHGGRRRVLRERLREPVLGDADRLRRGRRAGSRGDAPARRSARTRPGRGGRRPCSRSG